MSRSYHQSHKISKKGSSSFVIEGDKKYKIKNKYKELRDIEVQHDKVVKWKKKKHIAYFSEFKTPSISKNKSFIIYNISYFI